MTIGLESTVIFVTFMPRAEAPSQFHHRIYNHQLESSTGSALKIRQTQTHSTWPQSTQTMRNRHGRSLPEAWHPSESN